jgi:hypothetical protein
MELCASSPCNDWVSVTTQPGASRADPTTPESEAGKFEKSEMSENNISP